MKRRSEGGAINAPEKNSRRARAFLIGAAQAALIIPALFYLQFGKIDAFALSSTGFIVVLCLLVALGYSVQNRPEYWTTAAPRGGLSDRIGAFWLLACAFGPFFGWVFTQAPPLTETNWRWLYAARAALSMGLPVLTALPLLRYVRGRRWYVALLLLVGVTSLAVWSGVNTVLDLREGPFVEKATGFYDASTFSFRPDTGGQPFTLKTLRHTGRALKIEPAVNSR